MTPVQERALSLAQQALADEDASDDADTASYGERLGMVRTALRTLVEAFVEPVRL